MNWKQNKIPSLCVEGAERRTSVAVLIVSNVYKRRHRTFYFVVFFINLLTNHLWWLKAV